MVKQKYDPVNLLCTAPAGNQPWNTCEVQLCAGTPCTPITLTCAFNSTSQALCDVTGQIVQTTTYAVTGTAIKADGRRSLTGAQNSYTHNLYV